MRVVESLQFCKSIVVREFNDDMLKSEKLDVLSNLLSQNGELALACTLPSIFFFEHLSNCSSNQSAAAFDAIPADSN